PRGSVADRWCAAAGVDLGEVPPRGARPDHPLGGAGVWMPPDQPPGQGVALRAAGGGGAHGQPVEVVAVLVAQADQGGAAGAGGDGGLVEVDLVDEGVEDLGFGGWLAASAAAAHVFGQVPPVERAGVEGVVGGGSAVAVVFDGAHGCAVGRQVGGVGHPVV